MAAGSGAGIWKQTPGNVFVEPSGAMMSHFSTSEFDFRESFSPLDRDPYMVMMWKERANFRRDSNQGNCRSLTIFSLRLSSSTLSVSQSHRDSTVMGLLTLVRRSFSGAMEVLRFLRSASSCSLFSTAFSSAWQELTELRLGHSTLKFYLCFCAICQAFRNN